MTAGDDATAGAAGRGSVAGAQGNLFDFLREDHKKILALFDRVEQCDRRETDALLSLFNRIEEELQRHLEGEERFLYTALERHEQARDLVLEEYELDRLATMALGTFKSLALDDERWRPKVRVLRRLVQEHARSQEEELFPVAMKVLEGRQVGEILGQFTAVKSGRDRRRAGLDAST